MRAPFAQKSRNVHWAELEIRDMETLVRQRRVKFSGSAEGRQDEDGDIEFATAVGSAAYAVHSLEAAEYQYQEKMREGSKTSTATAGSRKDKPTHPSSSGRITRRFSNNERTIPGEASMRRPMRQEQKELDRVLPSKSAQPQGRKVGSKSEIWERNKMEKIRKRYEKIKSELIAWENENKKRVKNQMERRKSQLEYQSSVYKQDYQNKMAWIDQIAEGARKQMEEKRRNEEREAKENARKIRSTGRLPLTCFCFQCH